MKSLIVEKWTLKASGLFEADSVFLIEGGAFHLEGEIVHVPNSVAHAFG